MDHRALARRIAIVALSWAAFCPADAARNKQDGGGFNKPPLLPAALPASSSLPKLDLTAAALNKQQVVAPNLNASALPGQNVPGAVIPGGSALNPELPGIVLPGMDLQKSSRLAAVLKAEGAAEIPGEQQSAIASQIFENGVQMGSVDGPVVPGGESAPSASLAASTGGGSSSPKAPRPPFQSASKKPSLRERLHYRRLWAENLYFYIVTNIVNKWGAYQKDRKALRDAGVTPVVSKPREFFSYMRVMGQTGEFYVPGFTPREDAEVIAEARETFIKYFDSPEIGDRERQAFENFLQRAVNYNKERRAASKFRANVRDTMLKASVMAPEKIAPFLDGLPIMQKTTEFQSGAADEILKRFREITLEEIAKEPPQAKDRITGIILIGSFALGAATPTSDFDVEPLTADGGSARVKGFSERLTQRWKDEGRQATNPVTFHMFGYLNSRWEILQIHHEPYAIISNDPAVVNNLSMRNGDLTLSPPSRALSRWGKFLRWLQYVAVYGTSLTVRK